MEAEVQGALRQVQAEVAGVVELFFFGAYKESPATLEFRLLFFVIIKTKRHVDV